MYYVTSLIIKCTDQNQIKIDARITTTKLTEWLEVNILIINTAKINVIKLNKSYNTTKTISIYKQEQIPVPRLNLLSRLLTKI